MSFMHLTNDAIWSAFESCFIPIKPGSSWFVNVFVIFRKIAYGLALFPIGLITGTITIVKNALWSIGSLFCKKGAVDPKLDFTSVLKDSRNWKHLDPESHIIEQPLGMHNPQWLHGVSTDTYQDSGSENCPDAQWVDWELQKIEPDNRSYASANLFSLYQTDPMEVINRLKKIGVTSYRLSVLWSHIEPIKGTYSDEKIAIYVKFCEVLRDHGIVPMITFHHFSEPKWFHAAKSFEEESNIEDFVNYCKFVYTHLTKDYKGKPLVEYFCTINEPAIDALSRYIIGTFSPGKIINFKRAAHFLKNALKAHCLCYQTLKKINSETKIGFTHQYLKFIPIIFLQSPVCHYLTYFVNDVTINWLKTGKFKCQVPLSCNVLDDFEKDQSDFIGVQYYSRPIIGLRGSTKQFHEEEYMTEMYCREDPQGLYEAIIEMHKVTGLPVIVTENGISTHDEVQRTRYMTRALYAAKRAQKEIGMDNLIGYYVWCFVDNLEWDKGMSPQALGVYKLIRSADGNSIAKDPKAGIAPYMNMIEAWKNLLESPPHKSSR